MGDPWTGRDGSPPGTIIITNGAVPNSGSAFIADQVYFPQQQDWGRPPPDVAVIRVQSEYPWEYLPVMPFQDLVQPNGDFQRRYELSWPSVVGFSDNGGSDTPARRIGRMEVENDIEYNRNAFKLDAHGRDGASPARICPGDSGGPVLFDDGFGGFRVGGVISRTDVFHPFRDWSCPSPRGEAAVAFIPPAFLDRVAGDDETCWRADWHACASQKLAYHGLELRYLSTGIERCSRDTVTITSGVAGPVSVRVDTEQMVPVKLGRVEWSCGSDHEGQAADVPGETISVHVRHSVSDRKITLDFYGPPREGSTVHRAMVSWVRPEGQLGGIEFGVSRPGGDYHMFEIPPYAPLVMDTPGSLAPGPYDGSPFQGIIRCFSACQNDDQCRAYTYVDAGIQATNGRCWLKDRLPPAQRKSGRVSGASVTFSVDRRISTELATDRAGNDLRSFGIGAIGIRECQSACLFEPNCKAFAFARSSEHRSLPHCWLKRAAGAPSPNKAVTAGAIQP